MTKTTTADLAAKALRVRTEECYWRNSSMASEDHSACTVTTYTMAELFRGGDKAHRMDYTHHSIDPVERYYRGASPACGSKQRGFHYSGSFVDAVTCGRCGHMGRE